MSGIREADKLKQLGNSCFQQQDYLGADKYYTQAIQHDPTNCALFTNRALARNRLQLYPSVIADCERAIELQPANVKAYTYLGQALLALGQPDESLSACKRAYELAVDQKSPSLGLIAATALEAKKKSWDNKEDARLKEQEDLLAKTLALVDIAGSEDEDERKDMKLRIQEVFGKAEAERWRKREVPDYMIDGISFNIMWDPVITKNGRSYDRSSILDHLKRQSTDPLTREPLTEADLRPNLALRQSIEEFLKDNGWAADW